MYFQTVFAFTGSVSFFVRAASFNPGEAEFDPVATEAAPVPVSGSELGFGKLYKQVFTLPASTFAKEIWLVKIQRNTGGNSPNTDTHAFPVTVWQTAISYRAIR